MNRTAHHAKRLKQLAALSLLGLCACEDSYPKSTTLAELAAEPRSFSGQAVRVSGTLRTWPEPLHYWIEDGQLNRVEVLFQTDFERWLDQCVSVRGRFSYQLSVGRRIAVDELEPCAVNGAR